MKIAVDAMGGDYAPAEIVKGAVEAAVMDGIQIVLVGEEERIQKELNKYRYPTELISCLHAPEAIEMNEEPALAVRRKRNASLVVATKLVKEKTAAAIVSAGNTGAQMAAALFELGRIPGIERPGIATVFPSPAGPKVLIDSGANADCKARHFVHFAVLGSIYAQHVLGIENPRVALLNVGSEPKKGSEVVVEAYQLLEQTKSVTFSGNLEGRDFFSADVDVIVCDGFIGNIVLKLTEGLVATLFAMIKAEFKKSPLQLFGGLLVKPGFKAILRKLDYAEYGGAPLLGVQGISVICHGSSRAKAVRNAIRFAQEAVKQNFVELVKKGLGGNLRESGEDKGSFNHGSE
ncbi:MAG: phosphate acyltransferase PlsX [Bacillota bacterium]|nr:phosphate acyltransferase PlsX [Bacillota bacterium]